MSDLSHPAIRRVVEAAARKGVTLDVTLVGPSTHTAEEAASVLGAKLGQIVKSLVFVAPRGEGRLIPIICLVSGSNRVDLALLAAITGESAIRRASAREARNLTGYSVGGIPPFGHGSGVRVVMDPDLCPFQVVWAAAGTDSAVFPVSPKTLRALSNAVVFDIAEVSRGHVPAGAAAQPGLRFETGGPVF